MKDAGQSRLVCLVQALVNTSGRFVFISGKPMYVTGIR